MRITEIFRLVWLNLSQNKFKVILTSIGIVVGSATIMMVIAIGTGGKEEVAEQFKNLNAGAIDISYGYGSQTGFSMDGITIDFGASGESKAERGFGGGMPDVLPGGMQGGGMPDLFLGGIQGDGGDNRMNQKAVTLTQDDMEELEVFVPGISDSTISYSTTTSIEGGDLESAAYYTVAGVLDNYDTLSNMEISIGDFLNAQHDENKEKVCVLGASTANEIFGSHTDAYEQELYIDGRPYKVVGVLKEMGTVASGISPDSAVFIPYSTGIKYVTGENISPTITVVAEDVDGIDKVISDIETVLADTYPNTEFTISDAGSKMEAANASNETLQILLISMAIIVFIVGGIGIMNVLFVSVKERTNEIGILKALGCSRKDILLEFLLEAACISLVGAVLGVLLSLGITPVVELMKVRVELSFSGALLSLVFGVVTGSVFGFYPAYKASRFIPVVALNAE